MRRIADAGLIIAGLDSHDPYHAWARTILEREPPPWFICEPVVAEIAATIGTAEPVLEMLQRGDLELAFDLDENLAEVQDLIRKYRDQPMDLGDACVVRMSELMDDSVVYTVDKTDFLVYRRRGRFRINSVFPD